MNNAFYEQIGSVERIASLSKLGRLMHHPYRYISAILFRKFIYPRDKKERIETARLFFGPEMKIALPAATDIYLTGGKSHDSEIRLARFLTRHLEKGHHFLDIGAHYGYFSLIAAELVGKEGKVMSFEPSTRTFELLQANTNEMANVHAFQQAVSDQESTLVFYEFPNKYSEYNSIDVSQFEQEEWYRQSPPKRVEVPATTIDAIIGKGNFQPHIIKIDVEGAEFHVMKGGANFLGAEQPMIVMEYLEPKRHNEEHRKATNLLKEMGYSTYLIAADGQLQEVSNIDAYLTEHQMDSDNIVFKK